MIRAKVVDRRYPAAIEIAAYYVIAEALTNIARYARASEARIEVTADEDRLIVGYPTMVRAGRIPRPARIARTGGCLAAIGGQWR